MGSRIRASIATLTVVAVPAVAIRLLHGVAQRPWFQIEYGDIGGWLLRTNPTDAIAALARLSALVLAYYLLVSTLVYLSALASGSRSLIRITRPFALPVVRTVAERLIAGSIALGTLTLASPLIASAPPSSDVGRGHEVSHAVVEVAADYLPPARSEAKATEATPSTDPARDPVAFAGRPTTPAPEPATPEQATAPHDRATEPPARVTQVVARRGDHLWGLAESGLAAAMGRKPLEHELAPYWRATVDENRSLIRSGNPDLIYPGEIILLPDPGPFLSR